jgi:hypothetical protein
MFYFTYLCCLIYEGLVMEQELLRMDISYFHVSGTSYILIVTS